MTNYIRTKKPFWDRVEIRGEDDCWNWQNKLYRGYGHYTVAKGRKPFGENQVAASMKNEDAKYARLLYWAEQRSVKEISDFFKVSYSIIWNIVNNKSYKRVPV